MWVLSIFSISPRRNDYFSKMPKNSFKVQTFWLTWHLSSLCPHIIKVIFIAYLAIYSFITIIYYIFITHCEFSVLHQREGLSRRKSSPLILKDSDTVSQHCSLSDTWSFSTQGDSGTCCLRLELFFNWVSICAGFFLLLLFGFVLFFLRFQCFMRGESCHNFVCLRWRNVLCCGCG